MGRQVIALSVAILLAFAFCCGVSLADELPRVTTSPFSDVPDDHPNARDFALLQVLGIFEGYGDGRVEPDEPLERAQFAKVAVCLLNRGDQVEATNDRTPDFLDVDQIAPVWWGWINVAHSTGLIRGYEDGTFRHSAKITLAEAATVLLRVAGYDPFLEGLSYPDDYVALAEELGLTRGVELEPYVPVTRAEMAAMAVNALQLNPPDASGLPAADRISGYRENLLESRDERLEGFVSDVTPDELTIDGRPHPIASTVYLFGADSLEPLPGQWVVAYERPSGEVGFVEAAAGSTRLAGVLEDVDTESFRLRVGDRWVKWVPENARSEPTQWTVNGRVMSAADAIERLRTASTEVQVRATVTGEWAEEIGATFWDIPEVTVAGESEACPRGWLVEVEYMSSRREVIRREILFTSEILPLTAGGDGGIARVTDLREGDVIRAATLGGFGLTSDDPVSTTRVHRMQVARNWVSGNVAEVSVLHQAGDLLFVFELDDGTEVNLWRGSFLGAGGDMTLNDLYHASWVTFALGFDGCVRRVLEARVEGTKSKYVKLLTVEHVTDGSHIRESLLVVDEAGEAVAYQLAFPALWALFVDDSLELRQDRLVQIQVNDAGKCEDVVSWVEEEPLPGSFVVVFVDVAERFVILRRASTSGLNTADAQSGGLEEDVLVAVDAAVYTADGDYVGVESLAIGQKVRLYLDDAGDVAHIETDWQ